MQAVVEILFNFSMMAVVKKLIPKPIHPWNLEPEDAMALQTKLSARVIQKSPGKLEDIVNVAGVDIAYRKDIAYAAVVVMNLTDLKILEKAAAAKPVGFPYVPGLFSFREGPVILEAVEKLETAPDLVMLDGQGVALGWLHIVTRLLDDRRLVALGEPVDTGQPFPILHRAGDELRPDAEDLLSWLVHTS